MKILLVDDEPFMLQLLRRQLENLGFTDVILRERAHDALHLIAGGMGGIDLIFCDLSMPEMDGVEFVRHLVQVGYAGSLVLVSGVDRHILQTAKKLAQAHRLKVLGALHKPVSPELLQQVLEAHAAGDAAPVGAPRKTYGAEDLRRAIAGGELVNHYQPKVALSDGTVIGVETLVRWQHPEDGLVFPDQFVPLAEEHELIDPLTHAVLREALREVSTWHQAGLMLRVAVNVSMDNLTKLDFPDTVARAVTEAGVSPDTLVLEVTESRLMTNPLAALDILTRLRLKRISLSIDDFGTGHSSLAQLRDVPFDILKLDRSFVHGVSQDARLRAIFEANIGMARQLGMQTVAEGVEDQADWELLRRRGCDLAQGYFIARPMPAAELPRWLEGWADRARELAGRDA